MPEAAPETTRRPALAAALLAGVLLGNAGGLSADPVAVRFPEGLVHGFLSLHALDGTSLADGELIQFSRGGTVTSRLVFRFKDGSLHDETVVFSQRGRFRMLRDHLVQRGAAFPRSMETNVDGRTGAISVRSTEEGGKETFVTEHLDLPPDVSNGLILTLLKNIAPGTQRTTFSMVAFTPKPRIVMLVVTPSAEEAFATGGTERKATRYVVKIEIGGVAGVVAPLVGKQPPDSHVWILGGDAPAFVKSEGPLAMGADPWRIELVSPVWPPARQP